MTTVGAGYNVSEAPTISGDYKAVICFRFDYQMITPEIFINKLGKEGLIK